MQVFLIRHTTPDVGKDICYGKSDIDLATTFLEEQSNIREILGESCRFDAVYSSPLNRCLTLANSLSDQEPIVDDRLIELSFGEWELTQWSAINRQQLDFWMDDFVTRAPPQGESLQSVYQRTEFFIQHLLDQNLETAAVVTHAAVIRCFWTYLTEIPLANAFRVGVEYGDVFSISLSTDPKAGSIRKL